MAKGTKTGGGSRKGRPNKVTKDIKALAQSYGPDALETLFSIMGGTEQPPAARVAACKEILDRGYGKAIQTTDLMSSDGSMATKGLADFYAERANP